MFEATYQTPPHPTPQVLRFLAGRSAWLDGGDADDDAPLHLAARCAFWARCSCPPGAPRVRSRRTPHAGSARPLICARARRHAHRPLRGPRPAGRRGWVQGVSLLLSAGAKCAAANKRGLTPLGEAVAGGHTDAARTLMGAGANARCGAGAG